MRDLVAQVFIPPRGSAVINIFDATVGLRHDFILVGAGPRWGLAHIRAKRDDAPAPQGAVTLAALVEAAYFNELVPPKNLVGPLSGRWIFRDGTRKVLISGWVLEKPEPTKRGK